MTEVLAFQPIQSAYRVADVTPSVIVHQGSGGFARRRQDLVDVTYRVDVTWRLEGTDYDDFLAFGEDTLAQWSDSFLIDLMVDAGETTQHVAYMIPDTMRVRADGYVMEVTASLEAYPDPDTAPYDAIIELYDAYLGVGRDVSDVLIGLAHLVNVDLPGSFANA